MRADRRTPRPRRFRVSFRGSPILSREDDEGPPARLRSGVLASLGIRNLAGEAIRFHLCGSPILSREDDEGPPARLRRGFLASLESETLPARQSDFICAGPRS